MGQKFYLFIILILCTLWGYAQGPVASYVVNSDTNIAVVKICKNYQVVFEDISSGNIASRTWSFPGGTPLTSTVVAPVVSYSNNGMYFCSLTVTDTSGATNTINFQIQVSDVVPNSSFGFLPDVCSSSPAYLLTGGNPVGGNYFGLGVSNNYFDPGVADTGFHTLGYVYTAPNGCSDTSYSTIYVRSGPTANLIELSSYSNCNGFSAGNPNFTITTFDASTSPDSITKHEIFWGDGTLPWDSTHFDPNGLSHTYYGQGIYKLRYVVTSGNGCTDTAEYSVLNTTNPASLNIVNPGGTNGCAPVTVSFPLSTTNQDSTITYTIDWGDGKDTTFPHPPPAIITHTYDTTSCLEPGGFFNITAIAQNACVTTQSTVAGPFVTQPSIAEFLAVNGCVNEPHSLPNLSIPGYDNACTRLTTFVWDWDDGSPLSSVVSMTPIPPSGSHTWTSTGIYDVTLWVVSPGSPNCPGDSVTHPVCIGDDPSNTIAFTDTMGCIPYTPLFTNNSDTSTFCGPSDYGWFLDDMTGVTFINATTDSSFSAELEFTVPGIYNLSFWNTNECGGDTSSQLIYVQGPPELDLPPNSFPYCDTTRIQFALDSLHFPTVNDNYSSISSYEWEISPSGYTYINGTDSTSQYPDVVLPPNTYTIIHRITNSCGTAIDTQEVVVNVLTNGGFTIDKNQGCSPLPVSVQSSSAVGALHSWYVNGALYSNTRDTNFILTNTGLSADSIYLIELIVTSGLGCSDTLREFVTVRPEARVDFSFNSTCHLDTTYFFDSTVTTYAPISSWLWDFGDGDTSSVQNPIHYYDQPGKYIVSLGVKDSLGCLNTEFDTIWVKSKPTAGFNVSYACLPDSICILDTINLINTSFVDSNGTPIIGYQWDVLNDGILNDTAQHTKWAFTSPGSHEIKLTVFSQSGCVDTIVQTVHVAQPAIPQFTLSQKGGCTPLSVSVNEFSTGYIDNYSWNFYTIDSFGVATQVYTSNQQDPNPLPNFVANGVTNTTVYAALTAGTCGYSSTYTDTISVFPVPIPFFQISADTGCSPFAISVQTDGNVTGQPDSILFNYGDGTPMQTLRPTVNILPNGDTLYTWNQRTHTFTYTGNSLDTTYFITLRAINECGDSTFTVPVVVKSRGIQSFFTASTNYGCGPLTVNFTDNSFNSDVVGYCMDYDTVNNVCLGTSMASANVSWTFTSPGKYVVAQFVSNNCGADTSFQFIEVLPKPGPQVTYNNNVCAGDPVVFNNTTTMQTGSILGTNWDFGDGDTSIMFSPVHSFDTAGTYNVCLTLITNLGCDTSICLPVNVYTKPTPDFSFIDNQCLNQQPIQFLNNSTNSPGNIISYEWDFGDGNMSNAISPQNTYAVAGTYDVKLKIINDNNCVDSVVQQITLLPIPSADYSFTVQSGDSCGVPQVVDFVNNSNSAGGFIWDFESNTSPGQYTSTASHPSHVFTNPGTYNVKLVATNGYACSDTVVKQIVIHPEPEADFAALNNVGCAPLLVEFDNNTSLPIGFNDQMYYTWYFGDGDTSHAKDPSHMYANPGTYTVTLAVRTEHSCRDSIVQTNIVEVFPVPNPLYTWQVVKFGVYDFKQNGTGGVAPYSYFWDFGDGTSSILPDPRHEFLINQVNWNQGFNVCLTITDANGCDSTLCDTLRIGAFTLFVPNAMAPTANSEASLFLPKGQGLEKYECSIYDRWGNLIWFSDKLDPITASPVEGWDGTYNGEPVPAGVYVWKIEATFENGGNWRRYDENGEVLGNSGTITILR